MVNETTTKLARRDFLRSSVGLIAAPYILAGKARAADRRLVVRTPGGSRDDAFRETIYDPFRKETGIEVVPVSAPTSKLVAMSRMKQSDVDVVDNGPITMGLIQRVGGLEPIPYDTFKYTDPKDVDQSLRTPFFIPNSTSGNVIGYSTRDFPAGKGPRSWAEFWDVNAFPGPRSLGGWDADNGDLEMALLADGVPMDKLYPLDLKRAFASLSRLRPSITKFWESGAMSTQMLTDREVVMSSIWSARLLFAIDQGASLAAQWNQCRVEPQGYGIMKYGPNVEGAKLFVDYAVSQPVQSRALKRFTFIPGNTKAYADMPASLIDPQSGTPWTVSRGFVISADYWIEHQSEAAAAWANWIVQ